MSNNKVIQKHKYYSRQKCCICGNSFSGSGFREKYILGYTPEGYTYAYREYCSGCGEKRIRELEADHRIDHFSYFDE